MCGIAGFVNYSNCPIHRETMIKEMLKAIGHRGPDQEGIFIDQNIALGACRLSIIDLEAGRQPIPNEDKRIWIVFNGEIYNYLELREDLQKRGHRFFTKSDTEVILHLYEDCGTECVEKLKGMFAFGIWDKRDKKLILARDRLGIKPLYYAKLNGLFIFASEIKSILKIPQYEKRIDFVSLDRYLTFEYVPCPDSIFKAIKKLPAACVLIYANGLISIRQYWKLRPSSDKDNEAKKGSLERLHYLLNESFKRHMVSDVPIGVFLSGGIDSSTIVSFINQLYPGKIKTFSIGFKEASFDESGYAEDVSNFFDAEHKSEIFSSRQALELLPEVLQTLDEPLADASIFPTFLLSKFTRQFVKVALGGEGADELFLGYPTYLAHRLANYYNLIPHFIRNNLNKLILRMPVSMQNFSFDFMAKKFISGALYPSEIRNIIWLGSFSPEEKRQLYAPWLYERMKEVDTFKPVNDILLNFKRRDLLNTIQYIDINTYLADDLLTKVDRASMANSLEVRVPYLDHELVEFIFGLPSRFKLNRLRSKYILKKDMRDKLPKRIIKRRKKGFGMPVAVWIQNDLKELLLDIFDKKSIHRQGLFNYRYIDELLRQHFANKKDNHKQIWTLLMLELWYKRYIEDSD